MSNTETLFAECAPLVIHEMQQLKMDSEFITNPSARVEIIECCLKEVCRKFEKLAVIARTNPAFAFGMAQLLTA